MFDSFSNTIGAFNFNEIFEGNIIEVYKNNTCLVYLPKFFLNTNEETKKIEGNYLIDNSKILNHVEGKRTVTATNGIICRPLHYNSFSRKVSPGENVLVFFFNGDPQKPYYIDAQLGKKLMEMNKDIIFEDSSSEMGIYSENNEDNSRIIIKVKNKEYIFSDKGSSTVINNGINGSNGINGIIGSEGETSEDGKLSFNISNKYTLEKEWKTIQSERKELEEICIYYKMPDSFEVYDAKFIELKDYIEPIIENIETITTLDYETHNEKFVNYYRTYNSLMKDILLRRNKGVFGEETVIGPVDEEVIESVVKDLIYKVNSVASGQFIKDIIEDGIFSSEEKVLIARELTKIFEEKRIMDTFAPMYYDDSNEIKSKHDEYNFAYEDLRDYLDPMIAKLDEDTEIDKDEFYNKFNDFFTIRVALMKEIQSYSKLYYDDIEKTLLATSEDNELDLQEKELLKSKFDYFTTEKILLEGLSEIYSVSTSILNNTYDNLEILLHMRSNGYLNSMDTISTLLSKKDYDNAIKYYIAERNKQLDKIISSSESFITKFMEGNNIGSANLVLNSNFKFELNKWSFPEIDEGLDINGVYDDDIYEHYLHTNAPNILGTLSMDIYKARKGEDMVLSMWVRSENEMQFTTEILDSQLEPVTIPYVTKITPGEEFTRVIIPIEIIKELDKSNMKQRPVIRFRPIGYSSNALNNSIIFDMTQIKLEYGNVPTAWSPAREDYDEQLDFVIADVHSQISQTVDQIKLEVSGFEATLDHFKQQNSTLTVELDKILLQVQEVEGKTQKIEEVLGDTSISTTITEFSKKLAELKVTADSIMANIEREYIKTTEFEKKIGDLERTYMKVTEFNSTLVSWGATLEELGGKIEKTQGKIEEFENIQNGLIEITGEKGWIKDTLVKLQADIDGFEIGVGNKLHEWENTTIKDLVENTVRKEEYDRFYDDYTGIKSKIGEIDILVKDVDATTKKITEEMENVYSTVEEVKTISDRYADIKTSLDGISLQYKNIQSTTKDLQTSVLQINGKSDEALKKAADAIKDIDEKAANTLEAAKSFTTAEVKVLSKELEAHKSSIDILEKSINLKVWEEDIKNSLASVSFGGRNIIRWSGEPSKFIQFPAYSFLDTNVPTVGNTIMLPEKDSENGYIVLNSKADSNNPIFRFENILIKSDQNFVFSAYMCAGPRNDEGLIIDFYACNDIHIPVTDLQPGIWKKIEFTFHTPSQMDESERHLDINIHTGSTDRSFCLFRPKLEYGTKATAWTPAPEDVDEIVGDLIQYTEGQVKSLQASIDINSDSIKNTVKSFDEKLTAVKSALGDTITEKLTETINTINSNLEIGLGKIENTVSELQSNTEELTQIVGDKADISTVQKIDEEIAELVIYTNKIDMGVKENSHDINNVIQGTIMRCINDFSYSGNLEKWTDTVEILDEESNTVEHELIEDNYQNYVLKFVGRNAKFKFVSDLFPIDPSKDFRVSLQLLFESSYPNDEGKEMVINGNGTIKLIVNSYAADKTLIGTYMNDGTQASTNRTLFISKPEDRYSLWKKLTGYVYGYNTELKFEDIEHRDGTNPFIIKGNCDNALKLQNENVAYMSIEFEFIADSSNSLIYFAHPEVYQIDEMTNEQHQLLKDAYIQITPGKIEEKIFNSDTYAKDMGDRYTKTELATEITKEGGAINEKLTEKFLTNEIAGKKYLKTADYVRDTEKWRATFISSGGYNMLYNSCAKNDMKIATGTRGTYIPGIPNWYDNGGGCNIDSSGENVAIYGYRFYTNPSIGGMIYSESMSETFEYGPVRLKNDTDYVYSGTFWYDSEFNRDNTISREPLHFWCSSIIGEGGYGIDQCDIIDWDQEYRNLDQNEIDELVEAGLEVPADVYKNGKRLYVHFKTKPTGDVYFTPFIYSHDSASIKGTLYFNQLMLCEAKSKTPWTPHPNENYSATVRMDDNGILVTHSEEGTSTVMNQSGFFIKNREGDIIGELASKTGLTILTADKVYANNICGVYEGSNYVYVDYDYTGNEENGTSDCPYKSINNAIRNMFTNSLTTILSGTVTIEVNGTSWTNSRSGNGSFCLYNLSGVGTLEINIHKDAWLLMTKEYDDRIGEYEGITIQSCTVGIHIRGGRTRYDSKDGAVLDSSYAKLTNTTKLGGCSYVSLERLRYRGSYDNLHHIYTHAGTNLHAYQIDFGKCNACFYANDASRIHETDCCGNCSYATMIAGSGAVVSDGHATSGSWRPIGAYRIYNAVLHTIGNGSGEVDSIYDPTATPAPPPPTEITVSGSWGCSDYGTYRGSWNPGGKKVVQSNWGYGNNVGYACFNQIAGWCSGSKRIAGGSTITLGRPNEAGNSGASTVYLGASSISSIGGGAPADNVCGARSIGTLAWGETKTFSLPDDIAEALRNGSARSLCFYDHSGSSSSYMKINVGTLTLTVVKNA